MHQPCLPDSFAAFLPWLQLKPTQPSHLPRSPSRPPCRAGTAKASIASITDVPESKSPQQRRLLAGRGIVIKTRLTYPPREAAKAQQFARNVVAGGPSASWIKKISPKAVVDSSSIKVRGVRSPPPSPRPPPPSPRPPSPRPPSPPPPEPPVVLALAIGVAGARRQQFWPAKKAQVEDVLEHNGGGALILIAARLRELSHRCLDPCACHVDCPAAGLHAHALASLAAHTQAYAGCRDRHWLPGTH